MYEILKQLQIEKKKLVEKTTKKKRKVQENADEKMQKN